MTFLSSFPAGVPTVESSRGGAAGAAVFDQSGVLEHRRIDQTVSETRWRAAAVRNGLQIEHTFDILKGWKM